MMKLTRLNLRIFVAFVFLLATVVTTYAQQNAYDELDILFLVDQSGSMGGQDFGSDDEPTDPKLLRFESVQYALRTLSQYKSVVPDGIDFRMAVVNFGDMTEVTLNWTLIEGDSPTWQQRIEELVELLSVDSFERRNLGNTNFIGAIDTASSLFDSLPSDGKRRLKVIVVTTDGAPCAPTRVDWIDRSCQDPSDSINHMNNLELVVDQKFSPDVRLYVLGIDENNDYWRTYETIWSRIVDQRGISERIETSDDISPAFLRILTEVVNSFRGASDTGDVESVIGKSIPVANREATIDVPPYYQTLRITLFKIDPTLATQIRTADGGYLTEMSPNVNVIGKDESIEVWEISNPIPGTWNILLNGDDDLLDVYLDLITVEYNVGVPIDPQIVFTPVDIVLQINGVDDRPLPTYSDSKYVLQATLTVRTPSGGYESFEFQLQPSGSNQYIATYTPSEPGTHVVSVQAKTQDIDNTELMIINQQDIASIEVVPLQLTVTGMPTSDLLVSEDITISASILDNDGNPLSIEDLNVRAVIKDQSNIDWANVPLIAVDASATEFKETISMIDQGQYRIEVIAEVDKDTGPVRISSQTSSLFTVEPANFLLIEDVMPTDGTVSYLQTGSFPFVFTYEPNPLIIGFNVIEENDGNGVDLQDYVSDVNPITVEVISEVDQTDYALGQPLAMIPDDVGHYQLILPELPEGEYTVQITSDTNLQLNNSTLFATRTRSTTHHIQRQTNPEYVMSQVLMAVVVFLLLLITAIYILREVNLRKNPLKGTLTILENNFIDREMMIVQQINIGGYKKNRVVLKKISSQVGVSKIIVSSDNDKKQSDAVRAEIYYSGGKKKPDNKRLKPGQEVRLGSSGDREYLIVKDYDEF